MGTLLKMPNRQPGVHHVRDLGTRRPLGHPHALDRDRNGRPLPETGQVWVGNQDGYLWVVEWIESAAGNRYRIGIARYGNARIRDHLDSRTLLRTMHIWDDHVPDAVPRTRA